ncbi:MgtC/SapB family protein [Nitrosomonas sp.]|uniref:MgtC/SapB family protein n=1 Tax=Nitrosomonas sp. TaxID=42353 RepID=UPI001D611432|nr:MgtC/SapB family protein [Nitrosomonas sp.]MCB1948872.1 MgtC/SapB family protein [Nitrosomonas sp.]MCP5242463.1 MgtC/SapB family protein [Burkholderiales bacterium]MDR4515200.1 MgtC/SapB family protein [Nitrosomonas sp.]
MHFEELFQDSELFHLPHFVTSLAIGLLIGLERERSPNTRAGLRTFALVAVFGTLAAMLSEKTNAPWFLVGGMLIVGLMTIAAHVRMQPDNITDSGTTTVAAIVICYGLGAIVWYGDTTLAVMLAIITTILLYFKTELHGITQNLDRRDLVSILQFAVLTFIILPILPDENFGPYQAINPYQVWLMVVLISGVSLAGYVALHLVRERHGAILLGLLGGMVSSTATTLVYTKLSKNNQSFIQLSIVIILIANLTVLVRLALVSSVVSVNILPQLLPVLGGGLLLGTSATFFWWYRLRGHNDIPLPEINNPTEMRTAMSFGLLYAIVLFFAAWLSDIAGSRGLYAVALVSGLTDVDAISLTSLRMFELGKLQANEAVTAISLGIISNIVFKVGLIYFIGNTYIVWRCAIGMLATAAGIGLSLVVLL